MSLRLFLALSAFFCCNLAAPPRVAAMSVQPLVIDMAVLGRDSKSSLQVTNDSTKPLPVEFKITRIDLDANGEKTETPSADEFLVFPPQAIVAPGGTQVFRIQWMGDAALKKSQSYLFSINQVPVKLKKAESGVEIVFNFGVVVNVAPPGGRSILKQVKSEISKDDKGTRRAAVVIENTGTMHGYLSEAAVSIDGGSWSWSFSAADLRQSIGLGLVQPGKQRRFVLPVEVPPAVSQVTVTVAYAPKLAK